MSSRISIGLAQRRREATLCASPLLPVPNFEWSFSFGNGFQGTDLMVNDLYAMVYYPDPPPRRRAAHH